MASAGKKKSMVPLSGLSIPTTSSTPTMSGPPASPSSVLLIILTSLLIASVSINIALLLKQNDGSLGRTQQPLHKVEEYPTAFRGLNKVKMDLHSREEHVTFAKQAFEAAAKFSGSRGEGRQGWLNLLKAWDYNPSDESVGENLMANYERLGVGYDAIGYGTLKAANWSESKIRKVFPRYREVAKSIEETKARWKPEMSGKGSNVDPGPGCTTVGFATAFGKWDLSTSLPVNITKMNQDIYHASVDAYERLKKEKPHLNPTDLNHELWHLQRSVLDRETQSYWGGFQDIEGFRELVSSMRYAAKRFLGDTHGLSEEDAETKASHPLVVWVSVHTMNSVHQPHVTLDALVGGVYYVTVPEGSGRLELYDPRGKSPMNLQDPESPSEPPFHRTIGVQPAAGTLILFPGWLVHSVLPSKLNASKDGYRVSIALNLKGEWQTTAGLSIGCPTFS